MTLAAAKAGGNYSYGFQFDRSFGRGDGLGFRAATAAPEFGGIYTPSDLFNQSIENSYISGGALNYRGLSSSFLPGGLAGTSNSGGLMGRTVKQILSKLVRSLLQVFERVLNPYTIRYYGSGKAPGAHAPLSSTFGSKGRSIQGAVRNASSSITRKSSGKSQNTFWRVLNGFKKAWSAGEKIWNSGHKLWEGVKEVYNGIKDAGGIGGIFKKATGWFKGLF